MLLGPGDDTALVSAPGGSVLATTDALVRQRDWRDDWSTGADVGAKAVAQNCADIAAMGGVPTGLLVTLVAEPATSLAWVEDFARGLGEAARAAGVPVVGGDLSSAPEGTLVVSVTALGDLAGPCAGAALRGAGGGRGGAGRQPGALGGGLAAPAALPGRSRSVPGGLPPPADARPRRRAGGRRGRRHRDARRQRRAGP